MGGSLLNAIVLIASFSSLVASMFSAVIMLSSLARDKEAPAFLAGQWKNISVYALLSSAGALLLFSFLAQLLPKNIYNYAVTTTGYLSFINWGSILAARLVLCFPSKNEGRIEWKGLAVTVSGLVSIFLISIFSMQAPEQTYSFILTMVILLLTIGAGKLALKEKETAGQKENGRVQYPFSDSKPGPSLLDEIKIILKQK
jgi:L-asparagine transporter-like permease